MNEARRHQWVMGGGAAVLVIIALPLYGEFAEPGQTGWNMFLALFLIGLGIAAFFLQRFFVSHADDVGEARFDTRNKGESDG